MWYLVYRNIERGGVPSLILRLAKALDEAGILGGIVCRTTKSSYLQELKDVQLNDCLIPYNDLSQGSMKYVATDIVMTFNAEDFARCHNMLRKIDIRVFLYMVHPDRYSFFSNRILMKIDYLTNLNVMRKYIFNGNVFVMDRVIQKSLSTAYNVNDNTLDVFGLPIKMFPIDISDIEKKKHRNEFSILTVSRSSFPFKGYIKRLIYAVKELNEQYRVKLSIVTTNDEIEKLKDWIADAQISVNLFVDIAYNKLFDFYKNAHVYVGQGTTLIEAALCGTPGFATGAYTYDCRTRGLFADDPLFLGDKNMEGDDIKQHVESIILLSDEEYCMRCLETNRIVNELYGIDGFIKSIGDRKVLQSNYHKWHMFGVEAFIRQWREKRTKVKDAIIL